MLNNAKIIDPVFLRNLKVYPIQANGDPGLSLSTIEQTLAQKNGEFCELDTPDINEVLFINRGNESVIMLDGEEITGALQNRIIARSTIAESNKESRIRVICAEEGRWGEISCFKTGNYSYPTLRALLTKGQQTRSDVQKNIWQEIQRKITVTKTHSATSSMHDIFEGLAQEIDRYTEDFNSLNHGTIGLIGIAGNRILGCDIFRNSKIYRKIEKKLVRSYVLDALEYQKKSSNPPDVEDFFDRVLASIKKRKLRKNARHIVIKDDGLLGQSLLYKGNILHLSAFPA